MLRLLFVATVLLGSCSPSLSPTKSQPLLVDREEPRYGRVIQHGANRIIPLVRGDGIAEYFVPVQVGSSRGWWQVDTGAALSVVNTRIAREEGFSPIIAGEIVTAAGAVDSQLGTLPSVRIGDTEIRQVTALSLDEDYSNAFTVRGKQGKVIGILGADLLDFLDASIDLRDNFIRIRHP